MLESAQSVRSRQGRDVCGWWYGVSSTVGLACARPTDQTTARAHAAHAAFVRGLSQLSVAVEDMYCCPGNKKLHQRSTTSTDV